MNNSGGGIVSIVVLFTIWSSASAKNCNHQTIRNDDARRDQPHIITIIADDMGWNDVSFHGADQIPTPNIDALAANGIILNRYYVQQACTPSRSAYLTGRYPLRTGMQGYPLGVGERWGIPLETLLLPEHLRNLGYTTRLVGKWHVGYYTVDHTPTHRGFDSFLGLYNGYIKYFDHTSRKSTSSVSGHDLHRDTLHNSTAAERNSIYFTDLVTEEVEEIIRGHDISKPLYLQVTHLAPHAADIEEPLEVWNLTEVNEAFGYIEDMNRRKYAGMVSRLDQSVGRIVRALEKAGMLKNSIIIFSSDNGAPTEGVVQNSGSNYPLRGLKLSMFDGGVKAAACIYSPLLNNVSRVSNELMHITDWMPTLYAAAGGNLDDLGEIDGVNQWPALKDGKKSPRDSLILNLDEVLNISGAISGRYKLLKGYQSQYPNFYGDNGVGVGYPCYDATSVVKSDAGKAIAGISHHPATPEVIIKLRNEAKISCPPFDDYVNCTDTCLFDLIQDPCETVDISAQYPERVKVIENYIEPYWDLLIPQSSGTNDPASSPEKFGGVWMPWIGFNWNNMTSYPLDGISSSIDAEAADV